MASVMEISETDQAGQLVATYVASSAASPLQHGRVDVVRPAAAQSVTRTLLNAFLPAGYPQSVTDDYLEYQIYDSLQAFSSAIAGLLSSRAVLEGVGVGDATASPTAALLLSVLQESTGRIATILFAHRLGTSLEPECKMYRLAADVFNDAAMVLDCCSPALPKVARVGLLSCSSMLRALCGVAAGSSKASLSAHFATQGNLGELNAKDSSQETIISLMGMLAGSFVVARVESPLATWACLLVLLSVHLGMNYLAVRAVSMRTLNRQRANLVLSNYLRVDSPRVLTPKEVSAQERVFERDGVLRWQGGRVLGYCKIGVSLQQLLSAIEQANPGSGSFVSGSTTLEALLEIFKTADYILWRHDRSNTYLIVLKESATPTSQLLAWMQALLMAKKALSASAKPDMDPLETLARTYGQAQIAFSSFLPSAKAAGWDIDNGALETQSGTRILSIRK